MHRHLLSKAERREEWILSRGWWGEGGGAAAREHSQVKLCLMLPTVPDWEGVPPDNRSCGAVLPMVAGPQGRSYNHQVELPHIPPFSESTLEPNQEELQKNWHTGLGCRQLCLSPVAASWFGSNMKKRAASPCSSGSRRSASITTPLAGCYCTVGVPQHRSWEPQLKILSRATCLACPCCMWNFLLFLLCFLLSLSPHLYSKYICTLLRPSTI